MTEPYYQDNHIKIFNKDCRRMANLPDNSVQCVVTSPPYWGLRKYSGEQELIWGPESCEHEWQPDTTKHDNLRFRGESSIVGNERSRDIHPVDTWKECDHQWEATPPRRKRSISDVVDMDSKEATNTSAIDLPHTNTCSLCGAWKGAYGLEPTPEMYIEHTIGILREIRRVLRKDGVVFWNIGDSYWSTAQGTMNAPQKVAGKSADVYVNYRPKGGKPKDLCLIPFRLAIAAQEPYQEFAIRELSDRAWLAGIVDADGTIGIHHLDRGTYHQFQPFMAVGSSDLPMIERCVGITRMGGSRQKTEPNFTDNRGIKSNRPHYEWRLEGENAAKILEDIYPFLVVKEKQARIAHALWRGIQDTKQLHKGKGHKTPDSVVRDRLALWELIKKCNQREDVDVNLPPVPQHIEPGWWVRSVIIWSKPNPMPESVTDRPTESQEYILMLTKSAKYYWDQDAVRREYTEPLNRWGGPEFRESSHKYIELGGHDGQQKYGATSMFREGRPVRTNPNGANIRSVWEFPTQPYPEAHFAVFPEKLPEICIKAATPEVGCCSKCGAPWERITEQHNPPQRTKKRRVPEGQTQNTMPRNVNDELPQYETLGWQPTCKCNADKAPSLVLDPFMGAGTTLWVAKKLNRQAVGYEISEEYCQLALERNRQQAFDIGATTK